MPGGIYRVTVNGFHVGAETWDDILQFDGKGDEVFTSVSAAAYDSDGRLLYPVSEHRSPILGDINNLNGRVQAGSRSELGGLQTGDSFPSSNPWIRDSLDPSRNYPPCGVWSGTLTRGGNIVAITPSIWEWDPGEHWIQGWVQWAAQSIGKLGPKIKAALGNGAGGVVDAAEIGLEAAVSLFDRDIGPIGYSASRPIGMQRMPSGRFGFQPKVLLLNYDVAELLVNSEPSGLGRGVLSLSFDDDPFLRGSYLLYLQVERIGVVPTVKVPVYGTHSLRSANYPDHFLRHQDFLCRISPVISELDRRDATFDMVPGLADPTLVSFKSINHADHYLRHEDFRMKLSPFLETALFRADATFKMCGGLSSEEGVSFESINFPGRFIRHRRTQGYLEPDDSNDVPFRADATFVITPRLA